MTTRRQLLIWFSYFLLSNALCLAVIGFLNTQALHVIDHLAIIRTTGRILIYCFTLFAALGHMSVIGLLPIAIIIIPLCLLLPKQRLIIGLSCLLFTMVVCLAYVDHLTFSLYRYHLQGFFFKILFSSAVQETFAFSLSEIFIASIAVIIIFFMQTAWALVLWRYLQRVQRIPSLAIILLCVSAILAYFIQIFALASRVDNPIALTTFNGISQQASAFPLFNRILVQLIPSQYDNESVVLRGSGYIRQPDEQISTLNYPKQDLQLTPMPKPMNLLIIAIDAWRYDMLNPDVMPHLYQFSKHSWRFMHHLSGGNVTRAGIFSLFYGLPSTYWSAMLAVHRPPVLLSLLDKSGYQHQVLSSAELYIPEFDQTVFSLWHDFAIKNPGDTPAIRDRYITDALVKFIDHYKTHDKPFFAFAFYDSAHSYCEKNKIPMPYKPSIQTCKRMLLKNDSDPIPYLNRYKNAVRYEDGLVHEVLTHLRKKHLLKNTLVLITADHGEEFNDNHHNYWGHSSNFTDPQVQVPLLVHWPHDKARRFTHTTSHFDIVPSLMKWMGLSHSPIEAYSVGQLLTQTKPRDFFLIGSYVGYGIRTKNETMKVYPGGDYAFYDHNSAQLASAKSDPKLIAAAFEQTQTYYQH